MEIKKTNLQDCYLINYDKFCDERGYFAPYYKYSEITENNLIDFQEIKQLSRSASSKGVLRGFHFQVAPHAQSKIVEAICGTILDTVVDLRVDSPTFMQHQSFLLSQDDNTQLLIPKGLGQSFLTLDEYNLVEYLTDHSFAPEYERGILYNDPLLHINWEEIFKTYGITSPIISAKDQNHPRLTKKINYRF